jgi:Tol biopolymer transport system component
MMDRIESPDTGRKYSFEAVPRYGFCLTRYGRPLSSPTGIYVMNSDGSNPSRLSDEEGAATQCEWSLDGTKIAFSTTTYDSVNGQKQISDEEVFVINAEGSGRTNLRERAGGLRT